MNFKFSNCIENLCNNHRIKLIITNNRKKHGKIVLLAKSKLSSIEILIYKALYDSNISHDQFILRNNVLKEFYDIN